MEGEKKRLEEEQNKLESWSNAQAFFQEVEETQWKRN